MIGLGTSAPVSGAAAHHGHQGLAVGNLTGSNVLNLTLVLGLAGLPAPLAVRSSVVRREAPLAVGGVTVFAVLLLSGLDPAAGVILSASLGRHRRRGRLTPPQGCYLPCETRSSSVRCRSISARMRSSSLEGVLPSPLGWWEKGHRCRAAFRPPPAPNQGLLAHDPHASALP